MKILGEQKKQAKFKRNSKFEKKMKAVEDAFGITPEAKKRAVDVDYVIDVNLRTKNNSTPRFKD